MTTSYLNTCTALGICVMADRPVILWGKPGQGKTSVLESIAKQTKMLMETVIASIREPSDFAGLPVVDAVTGTVSMAPPAWARNLHEAGQGLVFYDEISTATPATQAALLRPVLEGVVGDLQLPAGVRTVAAANPPDIASGGWEMTHPMANRFTHLDWELPSDVVRDGFMSGWPEIPLLIPNEEDVARATTEARFLVGAFLGARGEQVTVLPEDLTPEFYAYPTPRSWEAAATVYGYAKAARVNDEVVRMLLKGTIGSSATGEFLQYIAEIDLPDPETILADPMAWVPPSDRGDLVYAIGMSLYNAVVNDNSGDRWMQCGVALARIADVGHSDMAYALAHKWQKVRPAGSALVPDAYMVDKLAPVLSEMGLLVK